MEEADKIKAMRELRWRAKYIKYQEDGANNGILEDDREDDNDFALALSKINPAKGVSFLDAGCGFGNLTLFLAKQGYNVMGTDISSFIIEAASEKAHIQNINCNFICNDFLLFDPTEKFDVITDRGFITILPKMEKLDVVKKMQDLLHPQGHLLMKIDKSQFKKNLLQREDLLNHFSIMDEWETSYKRSDGKPIPAVFFIMQRK